MGSLVSEPSGRRERGSCPFHGGIFFHPTITIVTTWVVGDIHGCADELKLLLDRISLGEADRLVSVGDLFHRGPDPTGVMDLMTECGAWFVLGNHEHKVLERCGLAPKSTHDRPAFREGFPAVEADDLRGDGRRSCEVPEDRRADMLRFLQQHRGYWLDNQTIEGAGPTPDGRSWSVVHAGIEPGKPPSESPIESLTRARRVHGRGSPYWYESYEGPELVLFGHTPGKIPRARMFRGQLVSLGLDTACVYGGALTAYSPELDEILTIPAVKAYATC